MIYRNPDPDVLAEIAALLEEEGFSVSKIVIPENVWTDGNPYFDTNASGNDILRARRAAGAGSGRGGARRKSSRSKPKRAGAKRRTVGRLRRVGGGVRKGHGVFKHGAAPTKKQRGPEHYLVWLTVPLHKPKIYGRYSSRRAADRVANALQKRADSEWSSNGRCDVSVESPDHQQLRHIIESYEQG